VKVDSEKIQALERVSYELFKWKTIIVFFYIYIAHQIYKEQN